MITKNDYCDKDEGLCFNFDGYWDQYGTYRKSEINNLKNSKFAKQFYNFGKERLNNLQELPHVDK